MLNLYQHFKALVGFFCFGFFLVVVNLCILSQLLHYLCEFLTTCVGLVGWMFFFPPLDLIDN